MKLLLSLSTFIIIIFSMGCECQDNFYGEPDLTISYPYDSTIEIYHMDYNNRLIGKIEPVKQNIKYAIDLHKSSMRLLLKYQSGAK